MLKWAGIGEIIDKLSTKPIKCFQYSDNLDRKIKIDSQYTSKLWVSKDGDKLIFKKKKFSNEQKYVKDVNSIVMNELRSQT